MANGYSYEYDWSPETKSLFISDGGGNSPRWVGVNNEQEAMELISALTYYFFPDRYIAGLKEEHGVG